MIASSKWLMMLDGSSSLRSFNYAHGVLGVCLDCCSRDTFRHLCSGCSSACSRQSPDARTRSQPCRRFRGKSEMIQHGCIVACHKSALTTMPRRFCSLDHSPSRTHGKLGRPPSNIRTTLEESFSCPRAICIYASMLFWLHILRVERNLC